eukprot:scaffold412_cov388-Prasinococcus_capsulatus_cf.AAC.30
MCALGSSVQVGGAGSALGSAGVLAPSAALRLEVPCSVGRACRTHSTRKGPSCSRGSPRLYRWAVPAATGTRRAYIFRHSAASGHHIDEFPYGDTV